MLALFPFSEVLPSATHRALMRVRTDGRGRPTADPTRAANTLLAAADSAGRVVAGALFLVGSVLAWWMTVAAAQTAVTVSSPVPGPTSAIVVASLALLATLAFTGCGAGVAVTAVRLTRAADAWCMLGGVAVTHSGWRRRLRVGASIAAFALAVAAIVAALANTSQQQAATYTLTMLGTAAIAAAGAVAALCGARRMSGTPGRRHGMSSPGVSLEG